MIIILLDYFILIASWQHFHLHKPTFWQIVRLQRWKLYPGLAKIRISSLKNWISEEKWQCTIAVGRWRIPLHVFLAGGIGGTDQFEAGRTREVDHSVVADVGELELETRTGAVDVERTLNQLAERFLRLGPHSCIQSFHWKSLQFNSIFFF